MSLLELIELTPKAELHVHIEGTMEPSLLFSLSLRNNLPLPYTQEACAASRQHFAHLQHFLDQYYDACAVLITSEDFYDLAKAYFDKAIASKILHTEVFFDPQTHLSRGISFETVISGLTRASDEVKSSLSVHWVMCFLRNLTEADALEVLNQAQPFAHLIKGVGLDSAEHGNPPEKFANAYKQAAERGFCGSGCLKVAHAGEECEASTVIAALYHLNIKRIDHGVRSLDSPALCKFLADAQIPLTVCPLSNEKLQVNARFLPGRRIVRELVELGIAVTINSDDPAFFGGYINENYVKALQEFEEAERKEVLRKLCKNSFRASFISEEIKEMYCGLVDEALSSF